MNYLGFSSSFVLSILFIHFLPRSLSSIVDPFDMRDYDPKTKTMRTGDANSLVSLSNSLKCLECSSYIQKYCNPNVLPKLQNEVCLKNSEESKHLPNAARLKTFLMRFVNLLLNKAELESQKDYEGLVSITLSPYHRSILNEFGETGNAALLQDIDEILSHKMKPYFPPLCTDDYFQKIYNAKEFFSQSNFIVMGILSVAVLFFYNVFVLNRIRIAFLSLFATIFFAGYFWTYWKLYEETISDIIRVSETYNYRECHPRTKTFLWFWSYNIPVDHEVCKEIYDSKHVRPLARLTPTLIFYETVKPLWSSFLKELSNIVIKLFRQLIDHSPWYIRWTVLPLILIFIGVFIIICFAFIAGKRFKLSHPLFGAIELDTDPNGPPSAITSENTVSYQVIKSSNGSETSLSCLSCGTNFIQTAAVAAKQVIVTKTVVETGENTDPRERHQAHDTTDSGLIRAGTHSLNYLTGFFQSIVSPLRQIASSRLRIGNGQQASDRSPAPFKEFDLNKERGSSISSEDSSDWENDDKPNEAGFISLLSDCESEDKENRNVSNQEPFISEISSVQYSAQQPLVTTKNFSFKSFPAQSPIKGAHAESKKKYFEDIKFTRSPDPNDKRMIPIILSEPSTSRGAAGEAAVTNMVESPFEESSVEKVEKFFAESNERIKRQLILEKTSARVFSSTKNGSETVETAMQTEQRFIWSSGKRKLSI